MKIQCLTEICKDKQMWVNAPFRLQCLSSIYWKFNFKIPSIVFGLRFAPTTNPQTHLMSYSGNACALKIDFEGVNCTAHKSEVQTVCLYKIRNAAFQSLKRHCKTESSLTLPGCCRSQHNSHHGCSHGKRSTCPGRDPSSRPGCTYCHMCCSSELKTNAQSQKEIFPT